MLILPKIGLMLSLSARRAWIEIGVDFAEDWLDAVALRKESVDRNNVGHTTSTRPSMSLSARRAWIEILVGDDGNEVNQGRSPQGERG